MIHFRFFYRYNPSRWYTLDFSLFSQPDYFLYIFYYSRIDGRRFISHFDASVFVSRRHEMCDVANDTLFYLLSRPIVHAEGSALPFLVSSLSWGLITKVKVSMALLFTSDLLFFSVLSIMTCHVCASSIWSGRLMISISTVLDGSTTSFVQLTFRFLGSPFCLPDRSHCWAQHETRCSLSIINLSHL